MLENEVKIILDKETAFFFNQTELVQKFRADFPAHFTW